MHVRNLISDDLPMMVDWFVESQDWIAEEGLLSSEIDVQRIQVWMSLYEKYEGEWLVWLKDESPIGMTFHVLSAPSNQKPWIGMVMVNPLYRRRHFGVEVVERIVEQISKEGTDIVYAASPFKRLSWIRFLGACSFEQIGLEKSPGGKEYIKFARST
ncbi:GNAT family N-acetyltransferase [Pseudalkalibacillus sp. SCS-8]|uniref:GNAT family N-acetyltransferase n=1 Tax=Pseudalkalibacillus nanhaiensis TaxID=3115291 RepID=UPI0032DB4DD1